jgi:uncharacterized protein YciI
VPETLQLLHYEYVPDMGERRTPYRAAHIELITSYQAESRLVIAGAVGDPPHGGLLAFRTREDAEAFVAADPYKANELVTSWSVEPWNVVT